MSVKGTGEMKEQKQIRIRNYQSEGFIGNYQKLIRDVVIPYQYSVLCDESPDTEKSHVVQNFINARRAVRGEDTGDGFYGMVFQDSDAAKWLEAAAYSLALFPDEELEQTADQLIEYIAGAQDKDGYLNTYYTIKDRERRWTNLLEGHELYCSGHMMEAACAYYEATGKRVLLDVMLKNAEHIYQHFIVEKREGWPGHPEVELALMKMYRLTGNEHCLELAEHFINTRGSNPNFYQEESKKRDWTVWGNNPADTEYMQSNVPVRKQKDATGHAVRAVYLYTGMADLASESGDKELYQACRRLWKSITERRMYVTGGIGSTVLGEAFSVDYDLPGDTAYAETCASIGLMFFASRMLENEVNGEYGDVMERAFYNTVLAGMQLDGKRFFYVNPLEVVPGISGVSPTHRHDLTLDGTPKFIYASPKVPRLTGCKALQRGPLIYCFEGVDNGGDVLSLFLKRNADIQILDGDEKLPGGVVKLTVDAVRKEETEGLYTNVRPKEKDCSAVAVPYYTWGNRGENQMRVWMNEA
ncbi:MAG: glycoside hydrolase family 127 protein [Suilimivivens sp.]